MVTLWRLLAVAVEAVAIFLLRGWIRGLATAR
jgi:hypothetical protein